MTTTTHRTRPTGSRWRRFTSIEVAADAHASDDTGRDDADAGRDTGFDDAGRDAGGGGSSLGLPVLAELPELAGVLERLVDADRQLVAAVVVLARRVDADEVAEASGVGVEHWLGIAARATRLDRRLLLRLCRLLVRLPRLCDAAADGLVSFAQLRGLTIALKGLPGVLDGQLDAWLGEAAVRLAELDADPDALVEQARSAVVELTSQVDEQHDEAGLRRRLVLQPRLDGSGGRFYGEEDAYGFAMLDAATAPRRDQLGDASRGRADNLQAWLHHTCNDDDRGTDHGDDHGDDRGDDRGGDDGDTDVALDDVVAGSGRLDAAGPDGPDGPEGLDGLEGLDRLEGLPASAWAQVAAGRRLVPPKLVVRVELDSLLGGRLPAEVLTRLVGGRLRLTSAAARRVVEQAGASVRAVVVDDGVVVGVGRASRCSPGWLTDVLSALHDRCTGPLCDRPALDADIDHAVDWSPPDEHAAPGTTDLDNLGPLCDGTNRDRRATGWHPHQHGRGIRTWSHTRSGLRVTSIPSTWRPPGHRHTTDPPDSDPPGHPPDRGPPDTRGHPPDHHPLPF